MVAPFSALAAIGKSVLLISVDLPEPDWPMIETKSPLFEFVIDQRIAGHDLASVEGRVAALTAAAAAGASYADLRIHRITTEIIQLRDGELEMSVVNREVGLAVRVIVDGTWGFASHAELAPQVAAETARRAVQVAKTLAPLNA